MESFTFAARLESLPSIRNHVLEAAAAVSLAKPDAYRLALAVDEIATNIINYGLVDAEPGEVIGFVVESDQAALKVTLEDRGLPFDPRQRETPDVGAAVEDRGIGGLGVFLALEGVDEFDYERVGDRNRNTFIMHLPSSSSDDA